MNSKYWAPKAILPGKREDDQAWIDIERDIYMFKNRLFYNQYVINFLTLGLLITLVVAHRDATLPGLSFWLLALLVSLVLLCRRREKAGPWQRVVLVVVVGGGLMLTGCNNTENPPQDELSPPGPPTIPIGPITPQSEFPVPTLPMSYASQANLLPDADILAMSVGITMIDRVIECPVDDHPEFPQDLSTGQALGTVGLGTFIEGKADRPTILTHNHYFLNFEKVDTITILGYQNSPFAAVEMTNEVRNGIRPLDPGTLIIELPDEYNYLVDGAKAAKIGNPNQVVVGQRVQQVFSNYDPNLHAPAGVIETEIRKAPFSFSDLARRGDVEVLELTNPNGKLIEGDSGGGVFWNGQVIANAYLSDAQTNLAATIPTQLR